MWNTLPLIRQATTVASFKKEVREFLWKFGRILNYYSYVIDCFLSYISLYVFLYF